MVVAGGVASSATGTETVRGRDSWLPSVACATSVTLYVEPPGTGKKPRQTVPSPRAAWKSDKKASPVMDWTRKNAESETKPLYCPLTSIFGVVPGQATRWKISTKPDVEALVDPSAGDGAVCPLAAGSKMLKVTGCDDSTGVAVALTAEQPVGKLILEAPYTSISDVAAAAARRMVEHGKGSIFFTGATASMRGAIGYAAFASAKFGLRAVAQSIARELGPKNIHVAHLIIDSGVDTEWVRQRRIEALGPDALNNPDLLMPPSSVADSYWQLYQQPRSAWTFEMEIRPFGEKW